MSNKATTLSIVIIVILTTIVFGGGYFYNQRNYWICENGNWIKKGHPLGGSLKGTCQKTSSLSQEKIEEEENSVSNVNASVAITTDDIKVTKPLSNETISNTFILEGEARGQWFFEAVFPVKIVDEKGNELGHGQAEALGDWMKDDFVPFRAAINFAPGNLSQGSLVLLSNDPSGLGKLQEIKMPVKFKRSLATKIKVFFSSSYFDPNSENCGKVYPVERVLPKTQAPARAAIEALLQGPEELEKKGGYYTNLNENIKLQKISIVNDTAYVDFNEKLGQNVGGSCLVSAICSQIQETLKQFPTIRSVEMSIDGRTNLNPDCILEP